MMGDDETMLRIANAIAAFELDIDKDCIIANGCYCYNCQYCDRILMANSNDEIGICEIGKKVVKPTGFCSYGMPRE